MSFVTAFLVLVAILELLGMSSLWIEMHETGRGNRYQQSYSLQINNLSAQVSQTQKELAAMAPKLAEYEIKAGNKE